MSKAVLISIKPEWCAKIASSEKTIEVRKTCPKMNTPFKCYIYCTNSELLTRSHYDGRIYVSTSKKYKKPLEKSGNKTLSGTVIGEFVCDEIYDWHCGYDSRYDTNCLAAMTCLDAGELYAYGQGKPLYGWHISELQIYDTPKKLSEFYRPCVPTCEYRNACGGAIKCLFPIQRAAQSWCYVEELE